MAALLSTGPPRVTKFEENHIPLTGVMLVLECLIKIILPQYLFYSYFLRISLSRTEISES